MKSKSDNEPTPAWPLKFNDFSALLTELLRRNKITRVDCVSRKNLLQCGMVSAATAGLRALYTIDEANECYWLKA